VSGVDDLMKWMTDFRRRELKLARQKGALPDTARVQYNRAFVSVYLFNETQDIA